MDREKVIKGLEFTKAMITFNPSTGEDIEPEDLNEANKTTYDACVGAIALLRRSKRMNAKQAAREAAKRIEDLEVTLSRAMSDIKRYNQCIDSMIEGGSPCDWCEDRKECHLEAQGKGCGLWMLSYEEEESNGDHDVPAGAAGGISGRVCGVIASSAEIQEIPDGVQSYTGDWG